MELFNGNWEFTHSEGLETLLTPQEENAEKIMLLTTTPTHHSYYCLATKIVWILSCPKMTQCFTIPLNQFTEPVMNHNWANQKVDKEMWWYDAKKNQILAEKYSNLSSEPLLKIKRKLIDPDHLVLKMHNTTSKCYRYYTRITG